MARRQTRFEFGSKQARGRPRTLSLLQLPGPMLRGDLPQGLVNWLRRLSQTEMNPTGPSSIRSAGAIGLRLAASLRPLFAAVPGVGALGEQFHRAVETLRS